MVGGDVIVADEVFCFRVQLGDGSTTHRDTPVSVSGLGSGVAMIALGWVRFVAIASERYVVSELSVCTCLIALLLCCGTRMCDTGCRIVRRRWGLLFLTLWFAESFLCAVQRRRGVMLGTELRWPSDACFFFFLRGAVA